MQASKLSISLGLIGDNFIVMLQGEDIHSVREVKEETGVCHLIIEEQT